MNNFKMFLLAMALTLATTVAFTVTAPKVATSSTALNYYETMSPSRSGYGRSYDRGYESGGRHWNRYDDDMYGDYYSGSYSRRHEKNIQFNAQIWTKSKFLGLSICVHNIGQGVISLSGGAGKGEEYVVTFPSGYGRSILSIPWIELGGQCEIRCAKTGYTATVDFHTKPFYGGKLHRTTTKVYSPSDKRTASVVLEGEWNGSIKYTSGGPPKGVFIDTQNIPIYRKYVRRMEKQQNHESRKMWSRVTNALATNNIDEASDGKNALEEKQRADRGHREENGITWENKLFTKVDDLWIFKNSLSKRLDDAEKSDK